MTKLDKKNTVTKKITRAITYAGLALWALIVIFPFYWMIVTSFKTYGSYNAESVPSLIPTSPTLQNYLNAFSAIPLGRYLLNTLIFSLLTTVIMLIISILAAFAFARLKFRGRNLVFTLFLRRMATAILKGWQRKL